MRPIMTGIVRTLICSLLPRYSGTSEETFGKVGFSERSPGQSQRQSFGTAVITPRWLFVLAAATPQTAGDPILVDESLEQIVPETIQPGDIVGISVHTGNALRGYAVGKNGAQPRRMGCLWRHPRHAVS